jgi:hypothetical protein
METRTDCLCIHEQIMPFLKVYSINLLPLYWVRTSYWFWLEFQTTICWEINQFFVKEFIHHESYATIQMEVEVLDCLFRRVQAGCWVFKCYLCLSLFFVCDVSHVPLFFIVSKMSFKGSHLNGVLIYYIKGEMVDISFFLFYFIQMYNFAYSEWFLNITHHLFTTRFPSDIVPVFRAMVVFYCTFSHYYLLTEMYSSNWFILKMMSIHHLPISQEYNLHWKVLVFFEKSSPNGKHYSVWIYGVMPMMGRYLFWCVWLL